MAARERVPCSLSFKAEGKPADRPLLLILAARIAYGYLMQPLGLVLATGATRANLRYR